MFMMIMSETTYLMSLRVAGIMTILRETMMYDLSDIILMGLSVTLKAVAMDMMMGFLMLTTHIDGGCDHDD